MIDTGHGRRKSPSPKMRTETSDDPLSGDMPGIGTSHTVTERNSVCEAGTHASEGAVRRTAHRFRIQLDIRRSQRIPFSRIMQNGERR